jgi:cytochrome c oxidase assembly factor 3, fungi type
VAYVFLTSLFSFLISFLSQSMSPGLLRARAPFRARNAVSGLILGAFAFGVYYYSLYAVKQEQFDDIDQQVRQQRNTQLQQPRVLTEPEEKQVMNAAAQAVISRSKPAQPSPSLSPSPAPRVDVGGAPARGVILPWVEKHHPDWLDPRTKTLVWGAPPVDNIGVMRKSRS